MGLDYGHAGQMTLDEITGGSPWLISDRITIRPRRPQEQQTHFVAKVVGRMRVATDADALIGAITLQSQNTRDLVLQSSFLQIRSRSINLQRTVGDPLSSNS